MPDEAATHAVCLDTEDPLNFPTGEILDINIFNAAGHFAADCHCGMLGIHDTVSDDDVPRWLIQRRPSALRPALIATPSSLVLNTQSSINTTAIP